jgi:hypothetical protein
MVSEICVILKNKLPVGDGDDPGSQLVGHLICLFTLIINIYGLEVGYSSGSGVIPHLLPEVNFLMVKISTPKPYIFMIRVTKQIKCLIAQAPGVILHPLPEVNFLMVEIPTPKSYIFMIQMTEKSRKHQICNSRVASHNHLVLFYK